MSEPAKDILQPWDGANLRAEIAREPYRTPEPVEAEPTDAEIAFWQLAYCASRGRGNSAKTCAEDGDEAVRERRRRFGVR